MCHHITVRHCTGATTSNLEHLRRKAILDEHCRFSIISRQDARQSTRLLELLCPGSALCLLLLLLAQPNGANFDTKRKECRHCAIEEP